MELHVQLFLCGRPRDHEIVAAVTPGLLTIAIVKTGITIVSYFGNVTASVFALTIVRKFTPRRSKTIQTNNSYIYPSRVGGLVLSLQTNNQSECDTSFRTCEMSIYKYAK